MRSGRPLPLLLAAASMAVAGMGVSLGAAPIVDQDKPRRRRVPTVRRSSGPSPWYHEHKREIARRLRQAERDEANRRSRYFARYGHAPGVSPDGVVLGLSRRGRAVVV